MTPYVAGKATKDCLKQTYVVCFSLVPVMVLQQLLLVLRLVLVVSSWAWDASSDTVARCGRSHWVMMSSTNRLSYKKQCGSKFNLQKISSKVNEFTS